MLWQLRGQLMLLLLDDAAHASAEPAAEIHTIINPCLPPGYNETVEFWDSSGAEVLRAYFFVTYVGAGNLNECMKKTNRLTDIHGASTGSGSEMCYLAPCAIVGTYQPDPSGVTFVLGSSYYFNTRDLNLTTNNKETGTDAYTGTVGGYLTALQTLARESLCTDVWHPPPKVSKGGYVDANDDTNEEWKRKVDRLYMSSPLVPQAPFSAQRCFFVAAATSYLTAFALPSNASLIVTGRVNHTELTWTSGALNSMIALGEV